MSPVDGPQVISKRIKATFNHHVHAVTWNEVSFADYNIDEHSDERQ